MMDFRSNEADRIAPGSGLAPSSQRSVSFQLVGAARCGRWSFDMDYAKPSDVVAAMVDASQEAGTGTAQYAASGKGAILAAAE